MKRYENLKIVVADDHPLVRKGVVSIIPLVCKNSQIFEASNLASTLAIIDKEHPVDLVLLDVRLPDADELEGFRAIKKISPDTPVALVSAVLDTDFVKLAINAGVDGYVAKSADAEVMANAIGLILSGEIYVPSLYLQDNTHQEQTPETSEYEALISRLTPRQSEVLSKLQIGLSNKEIANSLHCTESTIKTHISAILEVTSTTSRHKAVAHLRQLKDQ